MAFYKAAEDFEQQMYASNPIDFISKVNKSLADKNLIGSDSSYFDGDSIDIRVSGDMRTAYLYVCDRRSESLFVRFDFSEPIDSVYVNHEGDTIISFDRALCISSFLLAVRWAAEEDAQDLGSGMKKQLPLYLFDIKGKLSVVGHGSAIQGNVVHGDEIDLKFKLYTRFMANEEHKALLASLESGCENSSSLDIDGMDGHEFERFCADLLRSNGFSDVEVTRGSGDQGIDVLASKDFVKYGFQCKCYSSDIGNKAVQEALAGKAYYGCHVAVVLTNRYFTPAAKELAEQTGVVLWDRDRLMAMAPDQVAGIGHGATSMVFGDEFREKIELVKNMYDATVAMLSSMNEMGGDGMLFGAENEALHKLLLAQLLYYSFWVIDAGGGVSSLDAYIVSRVLDKDMDARVIQESIDEGWVPDDFAYEEPSLAEAMAQVAVQVGIGDPFDAVIPIYEYIGRLLVSAAGSYGAERAKRVASYVALLRTMINRML